MSNDKSQIFERHRKTLEGLAYRMLGTLAEAQDAVQETYLKWHEVNLDSLQNQRAWLITVCSRIALNHLKLACKKREIYFGEWLPEPYPDERDIQDPHVKVEIDDSVSVALLLALEKLSPVERAVFILHDIFELSFDEISIAIGKSSANCRQQATRARKRVIENRPRFKTTPAEHRVLLEAFLTAVKEFNTKKLVLLLAEHIELYSDGGGKVEALPHVLSGANKVASFFTEIFSRYSQENIVIRTQPQWFNGALGVLLYENDNLSTALTIETHLGNISKIYAVRNPGKFSGLIVSVAG